MTHLVYEIYYRPLADTQSTLRFPCDVQGHVDLDQLSAEAVENYLFARAMVGRDYAVPAVVAQDLQLAELSACISLTAASAP